MENYKVMRYYTYGWDNGFFSDDDGEIPQLFDSLQDAETEIQEHISDIEDAIDNGDMGADSRESRDDFRIMKVSESNITINLEL